MVNLASRCCQRAVSESTKKIKSSARATVHLSHNSQIPRTVSATARKQTRSRVPLSEKKANGGIGSVLKGRFVMMYILYVYFRQNRLFSVFQSTGI